MVDISRETCGRNGLEAIKDNDRILRLNEKHRRELNSIISVITGIMRSFEGENMQTQYNLLGYRIDLYFHDQKRAIEIDEYGWNDTSIGYEIERQKQQNKNLVLSLLELILTKKNLILLELSMKYLNTLNNQLK